MPVKSVFTFFSLHIMILSLTFVRKESDWYEQKERDEDLEEKRKAVLKKEQGILVG